MLGHTGIVGDELMLGRHSRLHNADGREAWQMGQRQQDHTDHPIRMILKTMDTVIWRKYS